MMRQIIKGCLSIFMVAILDTLGMATILLVKHTQKGKKKKDLSYDIFMLYKVFIFLIVNELLKILLLHHNLQSNMHLHYFFHTMKWFGCRYDLKVECGASSNCHKSSPPDACLFFTDNLVAIDHHMGDVYVLSILDENTSMSPWLDDIERKLLNMKLRPLKKSASPASRVSSENSPGEGFAAEKSKEQYIRDIERCQKFIKNGESYELCLTTQIKTRVEEIDPLGLYLNLRQRNPAPYAAWLNFPKENLCICCSSPERFLRLDKNDTLEAKPIKGTIARGTSPEEDELHKQQLQYRQVYFEHLLITETCKVFSLIFYIHASMNIT